MAADNRRRSAADARRVTSKAGITGDDASEIKRIVGRAYDRGRADERSSIEGENNGTDVRRVVLLMQAESLEGAVAALSGVPNSGRSQLALREATGILRDAARAGEAPSTNGGAKADKAQRSKARKGG